MGTSFEKKQRPENPKTCQKTRNNCEESRKKKGKGIRKNQKHNKKKKGKTSSKNGGLQPRRGKPIPTDLAFREKRRARYVQEGREKERKKKRYTRQGPEGVATVPNQREEEIDLKKEKQTLLRGETSDHSKKKKPRHRKKKRKKTSTNCLQKGHT